MVHERVAENFAREAVRRAHFRGGLLERLGQAFESWRRLGVWSCGVSSAERRISKGELVADAVESAEEEGGQRGGKRSKRKTDQARTAAKV